MHEILPGLHHWTTRHPGIGVRVSSYLVEPAAVVFDPLLPEGGVAALEAVVRPQQVVLTTGHHARDAAAIAEHFAIPVRCSAAGAERIGDALEIRPYADGEEVAPGVTAIEVGVLSADEFAFLVEVGDGALVVGDGLNLYGGQPAFFPDHLLGDDPEAIKAGLRHRFGALLQRDFDALLPAHGEPVARHGKTVLRDFVAG